MLTRNYINYSVRNSQGLVKFLSIANHLMENPPGNAIMRRTNNKLFYLTSNEKVILWKTALVPIICNSHHTNKKQANKHKQFSHQYICTCSCSLYQKGTKRNEIFMILRDK